MKQADHRISGSQILLGTIFQLILLLAGSFGLTILFIMPLFEDQAIAPVRQWEVEYLTGGTIKLLSKQIADLPIEQQQLHVDSLSDQFGFNIGLLNTTTISLPDDDMERLNNYQVVGDPFTYSVYKKLQDSNQVLVFEQTVKPADHLVTEAQRRHMGTFAILEVSLQNEMENNWEEIVSSEALLFDYPISLVDINSVSLNSVQQKKLSEGKIAWLANEDSDMADFPAEYAYKRVSKSDKILVVGPLSGPLLSRYYPTISIYFIVISLIVLIPLALWLVPTWLSLNSLSRATIAFGRGNFKVRARARHWSKIRFLITIFNQMAEKIQRLIESNKALVNAVSHELRTPISRIEFNIELARNSVDLSERDKHLDRIEDSVDELKTMVTEMLQYARFDREKPNFTMQKVDLGSWLQSETKNWEFVTGNIDINIEIRTKGGKVLFERYYMSRAISNLVLNAMKYASKSIKVTALIDGNIGQLWVEDDGPGVPHQEKAKIFEPFIRNDQSRNRGTGGAGLGLAIVMQIAKWHSGDAWVEDSALGGAKFVLKWQAREEQHD
jgi:two-component system sensor histidine kinase RstB